MGQQRTSAFAVYLSSLLRQNPSSRCPAVLHNRLPKALRQQIRPNSPSEEVEPQLEPTIAPIGPTASLIVDLTGSEEEATTKLEANPPPASIDHGRTQSAQVEARILAFRENLGSKEV